MPLYTFRCRKCGQITEVVHEFSEPHPVACEQIVVVPVYTAGENIRMHGGTWLVKGDKPNLRFSLCGGGLVRIYDPPNVHYRGSGFYSTDKLLTPVKPEDYNPDED